MLLEVITDEPNMPYVMSDLSRRRSEILVYFTRGQSRVSIIHINAIVGVLR